MADRSFEVIAVPSLKLSEMREKQTHKLNGTVRSPGSCLSAGCNVSESTDATKSCNEEHDKKY